LSSPSSLYDDFWSGFADHLVGPNRHLIGESVTKNGNAGYRQFAASFHSGFRLVATISPLKDRLAAEFFTTSSTGKDLIQAALASGSEIETHKGRLAQLHLNRSDAKIWIVWNNAELKCRDLWPVHYHWLKVTLDDLANSFEAGITDASRSSTLEVDHE
jgi:hypothetical protein